MVAKNVIAAEYDRQEETLSKLPKGFEYPLFNGWQAVQSQRKSAYKTTARAAREIVDNAIEAGAQHVWIVFEVVSEQERKSRERKNRVTSVAFIDDGPGMVHHSDEKSMLRLALSWGGGSHFDNPQFIGKFGFGLPNSSVNQTQLTDVFTRTKPDKSWNKASLDIRKEAFPASGVVRAGTVEQTDLPGFVKQFLKEKKISLSTGTVVVWRNPDRLTVNQRATLREHLEHDFQVVYRGLLDRVAIFVDSDKPVFKVDPLFLDPEGWLYVAPEKGGAELMYDRELVVKHYFENDSGRPRMELVGPEAGKDPVTGFEYDCSLEQARADVAKPPAGQRDVRVCSMHVRVSYLPYPEFIRQEKKKVESDLGRRFEIRKRSRGISFVRSGREIDTRDAFPKDNRDEKGDWPLLQAYAYYWGLEVQFDPCLDDCMGIGHDKQTVEPIEEFWRVLHKAQVDRELSRATAKRRDAGQKEENKRKESPNADAPSVEAANQASRMDVPVAPGSEKTRKQRDEAGGGKSQEGPAESEAAPPTEGESTTGGEAEQPREEGQPQVPKEGEQQVPGSRIEAGRFAIDYFEAEGGVFMEPRPGPNGQVIVRLNKKHPWYSAYATPRTVLEARNATNLLLFALGVAEIRASDEEQVWLESLRCDGMNSFLRKSSRILQSVLPPTGEEEE